MGALVKVHRWGGITIIYLGEKAPKPSAYRAYVPQRRCLDYPMWASNMPANIEAPYTHILPLNQTAPSCKVSGTAGKGLCSHNPVRANHFCRYRRKPTN